MRLIIKLSCFLLLFSCQDYSHEMIGLKEENENLKQKIDSLIGIIPDYKVLAVVTPKEDTIKLGQDYEADIFFNVLDQNNPPTTVLFNSDTKEYTDTLKYEDWVSSYKTTPTETGHFSWGAVIFQDFHGEHHEIHVQSEYEVEK